MRVLASIIACVAGLLCAAPVFAQDAPSIADLRERVARVEGQRGHEAAADALAHARRAIRSADQLAATDPDGSARARAIADAALVLADRLAARERARSALADARERKRAATRRTQVAREALERTMRQRDEAGGDG
ncbi:MAG: hypothetical protein R3B82_22450 [Sandaracinaceae bacterium]